MYSHPVIALTPNEFFDVHMHHKASETIRIMTGKDPHMLTSESNSFKLV